MKACNSSQCMLASTECASQEDGVAQGCAGVGRALAGEFLRYGDSVVICSRDGALPSCSTAWHAARETAKVIRIASTCR